MKKKKASTGRRTLIVVAVWAVAVAVVALFGRYVLRHQQLPIDRAAVVCVPTGSSYEALCDTLRAHNCIADEAMFQSMARVRKLNKHVKPGRYEFHPGMSTMRVVNKLYYGNQDAMKITIGRHRTKESLCRFVGSKLEMSADSLLAVLNSEAITAQYGFTPTTILGIFVQNTYDVYWNVTPEKFLERMAKEYDRYWTGVRKGECDALGLTPQEVVALASIVEEETNCDSEKPTIASVYLNRLRKGMLLQADPTVKYAVGDFTLRRILHRHLAVESPYNTYLHRGLPPGPICLPGTASIDAVLANMKTDYLYFCAKEDFSGRHNFAATPAQHAANAQRFHQALDARGIK